MNYRFGRAANAAEKKERLSSAALALAVGLALLLPGAAALAINNPIPGVDIIVKKDPGGIQVVVPIDDSGKFSLRLKEPGNYTISTACRQPSGCLPHKLSGALKPGADGEPSIIGILIGLLLPPVQKASADGTSYTFTVGDRGVVLSGQIPSAAGVRVAAGDVNGDGVETRKAAPKKTPINRASVIDGQNNNDNSVGSPGIAEANSAMGDVSTTRGMAPRPGGGDSELPGKHNYKGVVTLVKGVAPPLNDEAGELPGRAGDFKGTVTLVKGMAPRPDGGGVKPGIADQRTGNNAAKSPDTGFGSDKSFPGVGSVYGSILPGISDQAAGSKLLGQGADALKGITLPNPSGRDETPHNKYEDDFKQLNTERVEKPDDPQKPGIPGGPPVKVQLRNVDTGALAGTTVLATGLNFPDNDGLAGTTVLATGSNFPDKVTTLSSANGALAAFTGLPAGNYVVEIVNAAGNIIGTSASVSVAAGGSISGKLGQSERGAGYTFFDVFTETGLERTAPSPTGGDGKSAAAEPRDIFLKPPVTPRNGGDVKPSTTVTGVDDAVADGPQTYRTVATPKNTADQTAIKWTNNSGDILPGKVTPISGTDVGLEGDPGSIKVSTTTDENGAYQFTKLPPGKYKLTLPGLPSQSFTVRDDGIVGGKVMRGSDGSMSIFDRWGNRTATSPKGGGSKTAEKPVGFGSGNNAMGGPGGMGLGGGMPPPGAGPAMGGAPAMGGTGPMGGAGSAIGGPGSAMRNR